MQEKYYKYAHLLLTKGLCINANQPLMINAPISAIEFVRVLTKVACELNIKDIYCYIISEPALKVLNDNKVNVIYQEKVPFIRNRRNDGYCPMERLVLSVDSVEEAYNLLVNKINEGV